MLKMFKKIANHFDDNLIKISIYLVYGLMMSLLAVCNALGIIMFFIVPFELKLKIIVLSVVVLVGYLLFAMIGGYIKCRQKR